MSCASLLVFTVERRRIAIAVFSGIRLDYVGARTLSSEFETARLTTKRFVSWALATFRPEHLLLELPSRRDRRRRADLREVVTARLIEHPVGRTYIPHDAARSLAVPELCTYAEIEALAAKLFPQAERNGRSTGLRAAALGLHYQMTQLFIDH